MEELLRRIGRYFEKNMT